jgi:signal transduction histidine kinase
MRRWFATVRIRTTVFATLVVTAALVTGAILLIVAQQRALVSGLEQSTRIRAADVAALAKRGTLPEELTAAKEDDAFTQVVGANGTVIAASRNLRGEARVVETEPRGSKAIIVSRDIPPLEARFRVAARSVDTTTGRTTVYAGDNLETVDDATEQLAKLLAVGLPLLVGLVALTTWKVTGRALRPVEAIRSEVNAIGERELHRRVPEPTTDDEVGRLAQTMNAMLARLDEGAERQRRFVSDASHELQSPLTSLRARLEVNLGSPVEPDWRVGEHESLLEVTEMQRLVDDLLTLARLDARVASRHPVPVDLDDLVLEEAGRLRTRGRVTVDVHQVSAGQVLGDPDQLRRALRNVFENAERYAVREVTASVRETGATVEVCIADDGIGVPVDQRDRIFERFARVDDARTRDDESTGLGLAITREIVVAHGGGISVRNSDSGACFVIELPGFDFSS